MKLLAGRSAVVTGAARGNGAAIARALAEYGANVFVADVDGDGAQRQRREIAADTGVRVVATTTDVSRRDEVDEMFEEAVREFGRLDVVVNNAGILRVGPFVELTPEDWFATLDVNLTGAMWCCRRAAEHMLEVGGGSIVNITSMAAELAPPTATRERDLSHALFEAPTSFLDHLADELLVRLESFLGDHALDLVPHHMAARQPRTLIEEPVALSTNGVGHPLEVPHPPLSRH